jgi:hypothetical protein
MDDPLYRRVLGAHFELLPLVIQRLHAAPENLLARGRCDIERGRFVLRLVGLFMGLPPAGKDVALEFRISVRDGVETWTRRFDQKLMVSTQEADASRVIERVGPFAIRLAVHASVTGMDLTAIGGSAFGIPMPRFLLPKVTASERVIDGKFHFDVAIRVAFGQIIRYHGWLVPEA